MRRYRQSYIPASGLPEVISYMTMRRAIGYLGIALPFVLLAGNAIVSGFPPILPSISDYYTTPLRDVFVGILCAVSFFMFAYKGYDCSDFFAIKLASVCALGIALCPALIDWVDPATVLDPYIIGAVGTAHYVFAGLFFVDLAYVSFFEFTKTKKGANPKKVTASKRRRNTVYRTCAITIIVCLLAIGASYFIPESAPIRKASPVFWLETIALAAFGFSWLVKGEAVFSDSVDARAKERGRERRAHSR